MFESFTVLASPGLTQADWPAFDRRSGFLRTGAVANVDATVEFDAGRRSFGLVKLKKGSFAETHRQGNQIRWKTLDQCVQVADHRVVIAPGVLNVVLDIHKRLLQFLKVLAGFQLGIRLGQGKHPADRGRSPRSLWPRSVSEPACVACDLASTTFSSVLDSCRE